MKLGGTATLGVVVAPHLLAAKDEAGSGVITGEATGEQVSLRILKDGGKAVDAVVAATLTACITSPEQTGIGGYGMYAVVAMEGGKRIVAIDGNGPCTGGNDPRFVQAGTDWPGAGT